MLTDLLGVLVDHAGPPMRIFKLEGYAVFSFDRRQTPNSTSVGMRWHT